MKVLFDTNVIVDLWSDTPDFEHSYQAVDVAVACGFSVCLSATSMPSIMYLLPARKLMSRSEAREACGGLLDLFEVLDVTEADCRAAHEHWQRDYEDDLIAWVARRHGVDFIVTRNVSDFAHSPVPAMLPQQFVDLYKPTCLNYEMVDL